MSVFKDLGANKSIGSNMVSLLSYYTYSSIIPIFLETDDAIYLDGIPCDKYTLAPITFYKDRIKGYYLNTIGFMTCPYTSTRVFDRDMADSNKFPYRMPYLPVNTLLKNNARLSNGDEVVLAPTGTLAATNKSSIVLVISKSTNKITWINSADLGNYKTGIIALDDNRFITGRVGYGGTVNTDNTGRQEGTLRCFNKSTGAISTITLCTLGYIHNIIGKTSVGDLIVLHSIQTGVPTSTGGYTIKITFAISKISIVDLSITNLLTIGVTTPSNTAYAQDLHFEPALTLDNSTVYYVDATVEDTAYRGAKYTIGKATIDLNNGVATQVPITVDLNGLVPALYHMPEIGASIRSVECTNIILSYLNFGGKEYLIATNTSNTSATTNLTNTPANYASYCYMYLFEINGNTLKLVDYRPCPGGSADIPQAVFPMNNAKNILVVRQNGLDIFTVDTTTSKLILQDTINESIYSCGIDELERVWYVTSLDGLVNDAKIKVFSVGAIILVNTDFADSNLTYQGQDIDSNVNVSTRDNAGNRVATNLQLLLEGNAIFTSTGTKTINITTNASVDISVPIKVQGDGMISVYTNIVPAV
ncbi:hypothetical protein ACJDU8_17090 [Clostridium sp. WILCCON 0269]|uniref:Uncharacterized protein n=1 Tax=Candidatus Clostridium eludens TaxID=3381663 RepID=A0ABW8SQ11_9CLOT